MFRQIEKGLHGSFLQGRQHEQQGSDSFHAAHAAWIFSNTYQARVYFDEPQSLGKLKNKCSLVAWRTFPLDKKMFTVETSFFRFKMCLYTKVGLWRTTNGSSKIILKDKHSLLASLVLLKTFNILWSFPFHKKVLYSGKKYFNQNGTKNVSSMTSLWKPLLGTFIFKSVAHFVIFIRASHTWCARSTINISSVS